MNDTKPKKEQYVYIMSNACYDADVVKIGWTSKHPFHRVSQLNTGAPTPFVVDSVIITTEGPRLEKQIHNHLKQYRMNREFFKISTDTLREILTNEMSLMLTPITELDEDDDSNNCKYCNKVYTTRTGKWYHEKRCAKNPTCICVEKKNPMDGSKKAFECPHCGKAYDARNSLWYHEQKCTYKTKKPNATSIAVMSKMDLDMETETESTPIKCIKKMNNASSTAINATTVATVATVTNATNATTVASAPASGEFMMRIVEQLMEQNKTLQTQIIELSKERNMVINNTNNTTNNQQFNLQVFLNTECKDAIKLSDFVKSLNITVEDLEFTKNNGIIEGVSSIIVNNLKGMDVHKRPIHCTDAKRETMYVKADEWIKDDDGANIKKFIYLTSCYQIKRIQDWIDAHPGWESKEKLHTEYLALCKELYKNIENDDRAHKKIIKGFIKNVQIDKHTPR
jgi:uncharacterized Zn-finger protein